MDGWADYVRVVGGAVAEGGDVAGAGSGDGGVQVLRVIQEVQGDFLFRVIDLNSRHRIKPNIMVPNTHDNRNQPTNPLIQIIKQVIEVIPTVVTCPHPIIV